MPAGSRIVNVASLGQQGLDLNDLNQLRSFDGIQAYCRSKAALLMVTLELSEMVAARHVPVDAVHPDQLMPTTTDRPGQSGDGPSGHP
ncbi:hypothetical protein GCM10017783_23590 [Deinococcus piscis]|uniref:Short-chain dehydrogenase/reductase SDR n=1 Tax=Deinococcus piscis TaxID=394230 RepID=A0ABQ3KCV3_9DEIO|nr:hypothetical protein GCM10017783_23590 [Deinococcus piscis]